MSKLTMLPIAILLVCLLAGCAGLALLSLVFKALTVGALIAEVTDLFGHDSTEFTLYFDGYDTGRHPGTNGSINLTGLPTGHHLLTLAETDKTVGFHKHVNIATNGNLNLGTITPIQGGTIAGRLQRVVGGTNVPLAGVRVAAIFGGGALIQQATGQLTTLPPQNDTDVVMMGFTDATGQYKLGPAAYGSWLVTAAYPGHLADAVVTQVTGGSSPTNVNLLLPPDPVAAASPTIAGTVVKENGGVLADALVALNLGTPFTPAVDPARVTALTGQLGTLTNQPWFAWSSLATTTSAAGAYNLVALPGPHSLYGFTYGYVATATDVNLAAGEILNADFTLEAR
ncbi:MAG: carboxypeptidase-like regulatory domain-containing protein [Armatimonadetes bacterium]|nr:carboxypeptidase-like regulatory domain-containing protein [Armatimonadota bacterium]